MTIKDAINQLQDLIESACDQYEKTAPTVHEWLNHLYIRIAERPNEVLLIELLAAERLQQNGDWMPPNAAANEVYHLQERLGQPTTGQAGF